MFHRSFSLYNNMTYSKSGSAKGAVGIGNTAYAKRVYRKQTCINLFQLIIYYLAFK